MGVPFLDLRAQYQAIKPEIDGAIQNVVNDCAFALGKYVFEFEKNFAALCGVKHCIAVNSGTSALHLAMLALDIGPDDEVITAANTFIATCEPISYQGARPVLVDIDERTYNLDPDKLAASITDRTKLILPVHLYGRPAEMDEILAIADKAGVPVLEDSAQAHGATYRDRRTGSLGVAGCFSFYPGKNLGAYGEGGAVVTNSEELAARMRRLRDHGSDKKYYHQEIGYNYRLEGIQGAVLNIKLQHLEKWNAARRAHATRYRELLQDLPVKLPPADDHCQSVWHLFVLGVERRDELLAFLKDREIYCGIHYPVPVHLQQAYTHLGYQPGDFPITEKWAERIISLPMFAELTDEHLQTVTAAIEQFVGF
jgi:dTDP-4-amino-4,6-dideoxygalactose transaminase